MIAPCVGALWVGLTMMAAGDGSPAPESTPTPAPAPVAVMRPPPGDAVLEEAGSRIRSELAAMGLEGQFVDCSPHAATDATATHPGGCPDVEAAAMISLARRDGVVEISVRTIFPDGLELRRHIRVFAQDGGDDPSVLAVRAVELLRDLRLTGRPPSPRPWIPARVDEAPKLPPPPRPPPVPPRWRLSTAVALLASPRGDQPGVGPAFGPAIGVGAVVSPRLTVFANFAGPVVSTLGPLSSTSNATLVQALATLELRFRFTLGPLEPFAAVLTGVNYLSASFSGIPPASSSTWVPLFGVGGGAVLKFQARFYLCAEAAAFVTQPIELVKVAGEVVGRTGAPSILVVSGLGVMLP